MKKIIYKAPNGKLLRLQLDAEDNIIRNIKIAGDFFIYPEEAICEIEKFLVGKKINNNIESTLKKFLLNNNIIIIGFKPTDIFNALSNNNK
ncbi:MAG: lipoate protein ligase C-terminal domain-containing protein [Patescibacteria group bacterium]|nr:lipoate protein ligase C-terminal domain-containing protein [Patescibacteria group bacterium]